MDTDPPCTNARFATAYLNLDSVKNALHVDPKITWSICSDAVFLSYIQPAPSMIPIHKQLIANNFRVLIYSGDTDMAVPYTDSAYWTANLMGYQPINEWRPWYFQDKVGTQIAGFVTEYPGGFSFATIRGAGHMVPQYAPVPAFLMFQRTLLGQPL